MNIDKSWLQKDYKIDDIIQGNIYYPKFKICKFIMLYIDNIECQSVCISVARQIPHLILGDVGDIKLIARKIR